MHFEFTINPGDRQAVMSHCAQLRRPFFPPGILQGVFLTVNAVLVMFLVSLAIQILVPSDPQHHRTPLPSFGPMSTLWAAIHLTIGLSISGVGVWLFWSGTHPPQTAANSPVSIVDDTGLLRRYPAMAVFVPWNCAQAWAECPTAFLVWNTESRRASDAIFIPKRIFPSPEQSADFRRLLLGKFGPATEAAP